MRAVALGFVLAMLGCGGLGGPGLKSSGGGGGGADCTENCAFTGTTDLAAATVSSAPAFKAATTGVPTAAWVYGNYVPVYTNYFRVYPTSMSASTLNIAPGGSVSAGNCTGTGSFAGSADSDGYWISSSSGANSGDGSRQSEGNNVAYDYMARMVYLVKTGSSVASVRYWVGIFSGTNTPCNSDSEATAKAAFRFSTGVPDTNWMACTSDGATQSCTDTTVAVAADTAYVLETRKSGANILFYVNGVLKVTKSTNIPTGTTAVSMMVSVSTLTTAAKTIKTRLIHGEFL